jgi:hypothetical protein
MHLVRARDRGVEVKVVMGKDHQAMGADLSIGFLQGEC